MRSKSAEAGLVLSNIAALLVLPVLAVVWLWQKVACPSFDFYEGDPGDRSV